jgi:urease accessory protein
MKAAHRLWFAALLGGCACSVSAHTGHGTASLFAGLVHPLGFDHLLAMVAVGAWSVAALPAGRRLAGPAVFMLGLLAGAACGAAGVGWSLVEVGIAASVAVFGAMLFAPRALPAPIGLAMVGVAALLHGLAHGAELPAGAAFGGYATGFLGATAMLHGLGLGIGKWMTGARQWLWRVAGAGLGSAGLLLLLMRA